MKKLISILFTLYPFLIVLAQEKVDYYEEYKSTTSRYIYSSDDSSADNSSKPSKISNESFLDCDKLFLYINTNEQTTYQKNFNGYNLYLINKTDSTIKLRAIDSRFLIIAEVFYDNKWQAIEYSKSNSCLIIFYDFNIYKDEFWSFIIPKYTGEYSTKLRYAMYLDEQSSLYSNEIDICFNLNQLVKKPRDVKKPINTKQEVKNESIKNRFKLIYSKKKRIPFKQNVPIL